MSAQISPDLSVELIHKIIHEVSESNRPALLQCCLASKSLYLIARAHLWRDVVIGEDGVGSIKRFTKICSELQNHYEDPHIPPLISVVRSVSITILSLTGHIFWRDFHPPTEEFHYALFDFHPLVDFFNALDDVARSSAPGCGVHTIQIKGYNSGSRTNYFWFYVWKPIRDALTQLITAPTVHTIHIRKVWGIPLGLLTHTPALRSLTLIRAQLFTQTPSLDSLASSGLKPAKIDYLRVEDCAMRVTEDPPVYVRKQLGIERVPPRTFVHLIADPVHIRTLDLCMVQETDTLVEPFIRAAPYCEELTLRCAFGQTKDLPFHSLPTSLRHLILIPFTYLDFISFKGNGARGPDAVCEVFLDKGTTLSDAIFLPTRFSAAAPPTQNPTALVLPRVTIHRTVHIDLPASQLPTSRFVPMGREHVSVTRPDSDPGSTPVFSESFWQLFARSVYGIPAVEVEVYVPIRAFVDRHFEERADWKDVTEVEKEAVCRDVKAVFEDVRMSMGLRDRDLPKVWLHVSAEFNQWQ